VSLPCGLGKTVILGHFLKQCYYKNIIIVSPLRILAKQTLERLKAFLPTHTPILVDVDGDLDIDHVKEGFSKSTIMSTTFKSFANLFSQLDMSDTFVVMDESHHLRSTMSDVQDENNEKEQYNIQKTLEASKKVLLLTGTPTTFMEQKYEEIYYYNLSDAIQNGHICDYKIYLPEVCDANTNLPIELENVNQPTMFLLQALFLVNGMLLHGCKRCIAYLPTIEECGLFNMAFEEVCDRYHGIDIFGKWAHIVPSIGIQSQIYLAEMLRKNGLYVQLIGLPHIIYKPPGGSKLQAHSDGPNPSELILALERMSNNQGMDKLTTLSWMKEQGVQPLVHHIGGYDDGYTYIIGPMTPKKLYLCLIAVRDRKLGIEDSKLFLNKTSLHQFMTAKNGPHFMKWKENLKFFNNMLKEFGEEPIREIPIKPKSNQGTFVACWPIGYPHGSVSNKKRRITTTAPVSLKKQTKLDGRVPDRIEAFAVIASEKSKEDDVLHAKKIIKSQTNQFCDGLTHNKPQHAYRWIDNTNTGFYRGIAPTIKDALHFKKEWTPEQ
jgi:hypothetical protein